MRVVILKILCCFQLLWNLEVIMSSVGLIDLLIRRCMLYNTCHCLVKLNVTSSMLNINGLEELRSIFCKTISSSSKHE